jgi:putative membrane protein
MRTLVKFSLAVAVSTLALACAERQTPASDPHPQRAVNTPRPQKSNDPFDGARSSTGPFNDPAPQTATLEAPSPQPPMIETRPQKPFTEASTPDNRVLAKTQPQLSDAQVIGVSVAANEDEVTVAELAIRKATSADVKQFAGMMKSHHAAALAKDKTFQSKTKITPADSDVSAYLKGDLDATLKDLREKDGAAFDRAYMNSQVKMHKDVLAAIDNRLTPSASNGELRSALTETRHRVADHLVRAEEIQNRLETTSRVSAPASSKVGMGLPGHEERKARAGKQARIR